MSNEYDDDYMGYTPSSNLNFEILPEGTYDFIIHGVVGLGLRKKVFEGKELKPQPVVKFIFEIPDQLREGDGQTELLTIKLPISKNAKSNYYKFCTAILGANVTNVEQNMEKLCYSSGMKDLIGKTGTLTVAAWKNGEGRSVSNNGFYPLHPKAPKPVATRVPVFFNPFNPDIEVFKNNLTSWTRKEIMEALNADNFNDALKKAYEESKLEDEKKKQDNNKEDTAPWEGSTEAIQ